MNPTDIAAVVAGAGIGGGLRYMLSWWTVERWGGSFPWGTFIVNISGAFLLGIVMAVSAERALIPPVWRLFLGVGILGGYTTFSTLSYESVVLDAAGIPHARRAQHVRFGACRTGGGVRRNPRRPDGLGRVHRR